MNDPILGPTQGLPEIPKQLRMGDWWTRSLGIRARCSCGADRDVPQHALLKLFGQEHVFNEARDFPRVRAALVCGSCGHRGRAALRMVKG